MTDDKPKTLRSFSMPLGGWLFVLAGGLVGGGGFGSAVTGNSAASEIRITRTEVLGEIKRLSEKLDDSRESIKDHEGRIRQLEKAKKRE